MKNVLYLCLCLFTLLACKKDKAYHNDPIPEHDSLTQTSTILGEDRVINIWTPEGYENSEMAYPVLYMPDGGVKEDFPHIANTLTELIATKQIPPYILVGIENTERGRDMTGASTVKEHEEYGIPMDDGAKNFRAFIAEELIPTINSNYRTTNKRGIIGESLAGLFVTETFLLTPDTFDFYIAMDPSIWWNNNSLSENASTYLAQFPKKKIKFWFAGSKAEDIQRNTVVLEKELKNSAPENLIWWYSPEPNEEHSTIYRATKDKALIWSMN